MPESPLSYPFLTVSFTNKNSAIVTRDNHTNLSKTIWQLHVCLITHKNNAAIKKKNLHEKMIPDNLYIQLYGSISKFSKLTVQDSL
jgi:hypothetical protein